MKPILPLLLRRYVLGSLLLSIMLSSSHTAWAGPINVDHITAPGKTYDTLQEVVDSGFLSSGDTVYMGIDDSSLTSSLTVAVNFSSDDLDIPRTINLAGLASGNPLYDLSKPAGDVTLDINSIILKDASSGVIRKESQGVLTIRGNVTFDGNKAFDSKQDSAKFSYNYGGAIYSKDSITMEGYAHFSGNHAVARDVSSNAYALGGAIYSHTGSVSIGSDAIFSGNYSSVNLTQAEFSYGMSKGGAIYTSTGLISIGNNAHFSDNYVFSSGASTSEAFGGAIYSNSGSISLGDNVIFSNNYGKSSSVDNRSEASGGAIYSLGDEIVIGDHALFSNNYVSAERTGSFRSPASATGGAIAGGNFGILTIGANAVFEGNSATGASASGGAIDGFKSIFIGANAVFDSNHAYGTSAFGGAIDAQGAINFQDGATFINNYAKTSGGAIALHGSLGLYALTKDVLFSGNMTGGAFTRHDDGSFSVENGIANAIDINTRNDASLTLAAAQGREIRFNDPITGQTQGAAKQALTLNRYTDGGGTAHDTDGTIVFSGELYQGEEAHLIASRYSNFLADTTLHGGTLLLEHGVVFGRKLQEMQKADSSSLAVQKGVLEITGGSTVNAASFTLSGPDAVLRPGESAFINANTADFSRGFTFDMHHQLQAGTDCGPGLTLSAAQSFTAGGLIGVVDAGENAPYFYADSSWKQSRVFHVLTDAEHTRQGDFKGAFSQATGTSRVDSPYSYTGTWSHQWVDADGDGYKEQLQLVWKADGDPISQVAPELAGELAFNSLWSSASNAAALGGNVLSRLNAFRLADKHSRDLWGMGLGDFARQRSRGGVDGYDYNGGGYSVGVDSGFGANSGIWGIAFGQIYGHSKSRDFQGRNTQDTRMGSLYWGRLLEESKQARWTFKGSLTWAETHNKMDSRLSGAPSSTGKWNNQTWLAQLEVSRTADYAGGWRLTPFVRVEFTHGSQDAFREQGGYGRDFGGATLRRLSIPVGLEIGRTDEWKGRPWEQSLRLSYVGDALQDVPGGTVYSPYSDMSWRGRAVSPERHGLRAEYNTSLQCNERWSVYGGYGLEVRGSSVYHRVNAGVSRSF